MFLIKIKNSEKSFREVILSGYEIKFIIAKIITCVHDEYQCW